ncbi:MAG: S-adenosylmethionine uptake transporter [Gammaproteobacteria bacterium]
MLKQTLETPASITTDSNSRAIAAIFLGVVFFSIHDNVVRLLGKEFSVMEIMFFRALFATPVMFVILKLETGSWSPRLKHPWLTTIRGIVGCSCYISFYMSIASLPLATSTTIFFLAPIMVTVISIFVFKEHVGPRRWMAVIVGFMGIVVIVNPAEGVRDPAVFFALYSACTYAIVIIITRHVGPSQSAISLALNSMLIFFVVSGICGLVFGDGSLSFSDNPSLQFLLREWIVPSYGDLLLLLACSALASFGFYGLIQAYRHAEASFVAPFEYVTMPLAVLWGYLFWNEIPPLTTYLGILLIIGSGVYVLHREALVKRQALAQS